MGLQVLELRNTYFLSKPEMQTGLEKYQYLVAAS